MRITWLRFQRKFDKDIYAINSVICDSTSRVLKSQKWDFHTFTFLHFCDRNLLSNEIPFD